MSNKRICAFIALVLLLSFLPLPRAAAASAPVIRTLQSSYAEGDVVSLYWTDVGASSYDVFISVSPYGEKNLVVQDSVEECEFNLAGLPEGKYRANVRGILKKGRTPYSNVVYFTVEAQGAKERESLQAMEQQEDVLSLDEELLPDDVEVTFLWPVRDDPDYTGSSYAVNAMDVYFDGGNHGKLQNAIDINHDGMQTRYATREIVATAAGTVIEVHRCGHTGIYCPTRSCEGTYIRIDHEIPDPDTGETTRYISFYCHLDPKTIAVEEGDEVAQGQTIARMGSTGNSSGIHLHFAIRDGDNADVPTLEFFMNDYYMPLLQFKYFKKSKSGNFVTTSGRTSRYSDWIAAHYTYASDRWVYAGDR